jgi:AcrR family transcriptional regulator
MLNKGSTETKDKILEAAFDLFGRYGFEGTSIRAISSKSKVNLAAINYHFKTKEALFWEVMAQAFRDLDHAIKDYAVGSMDTVDLAMKVFDHFQSEKLAVKCTMKMLLDEGISPPESREIREVLDSPMGPPGGLYFAQIIQRDIPFRLSEEGLLWSIKSIFGCIFHWGVMLCADQICHMDKLSDPMMGPEQIRRDVVHMVKSSLEYIKQNEALFRAKV